MNFVVIDSDSKLRTKFKSKEEIKRLLDDSDCQVYQLETDELSKCEYKLNSVFELSDCNRLVFITSFSNGVMGYHRKLFVNNTEFQKLTITIVDAENDIYQDQIISELNSILTGKKLLYNVLADTSDTLLLTSKECKKKINTQKRLSIVSKNMDLAKKTSELFLKLLDEWQVIFTNNPDNETYDDSNMVILIGEQISDFDFEAPKSGMGKYFVWYNANKLGYNDTYVSDIKFSVRERLIDAGWNINSSMDIYVSNIIYEVFNVNILTNACSFSSLIGNENFVMWDKFGLPLICSQQNDNKIYEFINRICCFEKISKQAD